MVRQGKATVTLHHQIYAAVAPIEKPHETSCRRSGHATTIQPSIIKNYTVVVGSTIIL